MKFQTAIIIVTAFVATACGKPDRDGKSTANRDVFGNMSSVMQLAVPDKSFSRDPSPFAVTAQANYDLLMDTVNSMAASLKESNSRFEQVKNEGTRSNGDLTITHTTLSAQLVGVRNSSNGTIAWTYTKSGATYFTGTTSGRGDSGELVFPANAISFRAVTLRWEGTKVTVLQDAANFLEFNVTSLDGAASVTGLVTGTLKVSGEWNSNGGSFKRSENESSRCWNARFENIDCL